MEDGCRSPAPDGRHAVRDADRLRRREAPLRHRPDFGDQRSHLHVSPIPATGSDAADRHCQDERAASAPDTPGSGRRLRLGVSLVCAARSAPSPRRPGSRRRRGRHRAHARAGQAGRRPARAHRRGAPPHRGEGLSAGRARAAAATRDLLEQHYAEHVGKPFYAPLVAFMSSGPVVAAVVEGERVVEGWRALMGKTDPTRPSRARSAATSAATGAVPSRRTSCTAPTRPSRPRARSGSGSPGSDPPAGTSSQRRWSG